MHTSEQNYIDIAKRYLLIALKATKSFNDAQASLHLEKVLTRQRLGTAEGRAESLAVLDQVRELTRTHKDDFNKIVDASVVEFAVAIAAMPEQMRQQYLDEFHETLNWQFNAQISFYPNRERWIDAATQICQLIDARRHTAGGDEQGMDFDNEEDVQRFSALLAIIDETHEFEQAQVKERAQRFEQTATMLGLRNS